MKRNLVVTNSSTDLNGRVESCHELDAASNVADARAKRRDVLNRLLTDAATDNRRYVEKYRAGRGAE